MAWLRRRQRLLLLAAALQRLWLPAGLPAQQRRQGGLSWLLLLQALQLQQRQLQRRLQLLLWPQAAPSAQLQRLQLQQ